MAIPRPVSAGSKSFNDGASVQMRDFNSISRLTNSSTATLTKVDTQDVEDQGSQALVANMEEIALKALHTDNDPTLNPWTFRTFFLGKFWSWPVGFPYSVGLEVDSAVPFITPASFSASYFKRKLL